MVNENIINRKDMATTEFIAAIELSSSKISGIAGKKPLLLSIKESSTTLIRPHRP